MPGKVRDPNFIDGVSFQRFAILAVEDMAGLKENLTRQDADGRAGQRKTVDPGRNFQFFVIFIPADRRQIVPLGVEEHIVDQHLRALDNRRFAGAQFFVDFFESRFGKRRILFFRAPTGVILLKGCRNHLFMAEKIVNIFVALHPEGAHEGRNRQFAGLVDFHVENARGIGLIFQPGTTVGDHHVGVTVIPVFIHVATVINPRGTDKLRNNHAFRTVDHERAAVGHQREVPHINLVLFDLAGLFVGQTHKHFQGSFIGRVTLLALLHRILGGVFDREVHKLDGQVPAVIVDGGNIVQNLHHSVAAEPFKRLLLHLNEVRHIQGFIDLGESKSCGFAELQGF